MVGGSPQVYSFPDIDSLAKDLRKYILRTQNISLHRHGTFRVAVSGGSLPAILAKALLPPANGSEEDIPHFSDWDIFLADERVVPLDHEDSNYRLIKAELLDQISPELGIPKIHPIDVTYIDDDDPQEVADQYQEELMRTFAAKDSVKLPVFDLLLLGCGPDGHTCSLFPDHEVLREADSWVAPISDSPKPPPKRITLTLPVITHGLRIAVVATGEGKREVLRKIFDTEEGRSLPCGLVNVRGAEKVSWFTDSKAVDGVEFPRKGSL